MKLSLSCLAVALALPSLSCAVRLAGICADQHRIKEVVAPPAGWIKHGPAPSHSIITLNIGLPHSNFDDLERHLYQVSDPSHERYGQHLSKQQVETLVAPHPRSLDAVDVWLACHGISQADVTRSPAKDWVVARIPVSLAEKMLDTVRSLFNLTYFINIYRHFQTYSVWRHSGTGVSIIRTLQYSLPKQIHEHVDVVQPTTMFGSLKDFKTNFHVDDTVEPQLDGFDTPILATASGGRLNASCNHTITASCLKQLYGTAGYQPSAGNQNRIGITGFLGQFANIADLQLFYANQTPDALGSSFELISING